MTLLYIYMTKGELPEKKLEVIKIMSLAPNYLIVDKELYRQGLSMSYLEMRRSTLNWKKKLKEVHEGIVACHEGA